jgi:rod shape determining protein RodA
LLRGRVHQLRSIRIGRNPPVFSRPRSLRAPAELLNRVLNLEKQERSRVGIDRRVIGNFDWFMFSLVLFMSVVGVMTIYSATRPIGLTDAGSNLYVKQIFWLCLAIIALVVFASIDYMWFDRFSTLLYVGGVLSLAAVLVLGKMGMGAKRWIQLGPLTFQPSEFFKILFLIAIAGRISKIRGNLRFRDLVKAAILYLILPVILIMKEPDLGTALILVIIFLIVTLIRGFYKKVLVILIMIGAISAPFLGTVVWSKLKPYQKNRIIAFVEPQVDPSGIGYQIEQSKISIGSGKFFGKGYLRGTQGPFQFLPENHTDFIFSGFAEEWGFLGSFLLIAVYLLVILRGIDTALKAKDSFGRFLAFSVVTLFFVYFFINAGMVVGMMPVVGVPFPFLSYGGTALISNFAAAGLLINVRMRRFTLFY